jgi:prophage regulatory protein
MEKTRILRLEEVMNLTGLPRVTLWREEKLGRFPKRRLLTSRNVGWLCSEIFEWISTRPVVGATA